jgi:hypothetical protein
MAKSGFKQDTTLLTQTAAQGQQAAADILNLHRGAEHDEQTAEFNPVYKSHRIEMGKAASCMQPSEFLSEPQ